ncbi:MAG: hypothetical protein ACJAYU_005062 [Bradymonadia bacterium]|jgi:hypothetical protein
MRSIRIPFLAATLILAFSACEATEDPFIDSTNTNPDTGSRDTGSTDLGNEDTAVDVGGEDTGAEDAVADVFPDTPRDASGLACGEGVVFTGQVFVGSDPDPSSPNGGAPRFEPYDAAYDAGIAALLAAAPADGADPVVGEWTITDATVVATDFNNENTQRAQRVFFLADANGTISTFFQEEDTDSQPSFSIKVGQRVSGTVTSLGNFGGGSQVSTASGWQLESEGNDVYIRDIGDEALTPADINSVVRVTGTVDGVDQPECGGSSTCYNMSYGSQSVILRSASQFLAVGNCVTYVGPVRAFGNNPQLDTVNFDWLWVYNED